MVFWDLRRLNGFPEFRSNVDENESIISFGVRDLLPNGRDYEYLDADAWDGRWPGVAFVKRLNQTEKLYFNGDAIRTLPRWLGKVPKLKELHIIADYSPREEIQNLSQLRIPISLRFAQQLKKIEIKNVNLAHLPEEFGQIENLQECTLENCGLTTLPLTMRNLTNLKELAIIYMPIRNFPSILFQMNKLIKLYIQNTEIDTLPDNFQNCNQLKILSIHNNCISTLPSSIEQLIELERLNLSGNDFTEVPPILRHLPKLRSLSLSRNRIKEIPAWLGEIRADGSTLKELAIDELPDHLDAKESYLRAYQPHFLRPPNPILQFPAWVRNSQLEMVTLGIVVRSLYGLPPNAMVWAAVNSYYQPSHYDLPNTVTQWVREVENIRFSVHSPNLGSLGIVSVLSESSIGSNYKLYFEEPLAVDLRNQLIAYYTLSVEDISIKLVKTGQITTYEQERLLHECTPGIRAYLDANLPSDHPILLTLTERAKIPLSNEFSVLL